LGVSRKYPTKASVGRRRERKRSADRESKRRNRDETEIDTERAERIPRRRRVHISENWGPGTGGNWGVTTVNKLHEFYYNWGVPI